MIARDTDRAMLDAVDPDQAPWELGAVQIDLLDGPHQHQSAPWGLLKAAFETYNSRPEGAALAPKEPLSPRRSR